MSAQRRFRITRRWRQNRLVYGLTDLLANSLIVFCGVRPVVAPPGFIAIDPHVHSSFSRCSRSSIERILVRAAEMGLSAVGIMDHNDLRSVAAASAVAKDLKNRKLIPEDFCVLPGVEIHSGAGHVAALFVTEPIPVKLGVKETVRRIHELGGIAIAPHPYIRSGIRDALFEADFDAVEVESGSVFSRALTARLHEDMKDERLTNAASLGSSDAHYVGAIGICYTLVEASEPTPEAIRSAILAGRCTAHASPACLRMRKTLGHIIPR